MSTRKVLGVGPAAAGADALIPLGPQHPGAHGALRLAVRLDGDRIAAAEPVIGFMHRGAEKLFEVRDYRQIVVLTNRHDWLSAFANELGLVLAVERMLGIQLPQRARWLRTALAELNRVLHHLAFLQALAQMLTATGVAQAAGEARESLQDCFEAASGGRVHYMFNRVGGLKEDVPAGWSTLLTEALGPARRVAEGQLRELLEARATVSALAGLGQLAKQTAEDYGVSGPVARASGLNFDLRRDDPYLGYSELDVQPVTATSGDCLARYQCLLAEIPVAVELVLAALSRADQVAGPVNVRLPKSLRPPEGHIYTWTENPAGINGYFLVSRGGPTPWRLKLRTASFNNVQVLREILPGLKVSELPLVLSSLFYVSGDIDR
ncbi:MAG: NADH-quinone oxidoreductase subunit D [Mycobacteriales bacterium]